MSVAELDWSQPAHFTGGGEGGKGVVAPPYDYILAADCIYHEHLVRHLYRALLALSNERTVILVANERRSESVQAAFVDLFSPSFNFKKVGGCGWCALHSCCCGLWWVCRCLTRGPRACAHIVP